MSTKIWTCADITPDRHDRAAIIDARLSGNGMAVALRDTRNQDVVNGPQEIS